MTGKVFTVLSIVIMIPMGTPLLPNEPGFTCHICWGHAKPFGIAPTPKVIQIRLTALLPGEHATDEVMQNLLVTHYLEQQPDPCRYEITDGAFLWFVEWAPTATLIAVRNTITLRFAFVVVTPAICQVDLPSDISGPLGNIAWNGFANITWDPEGLE